MNVKSHLLLFASTVLIGSVHAAPIFSSSISASGSNFYEAGGKGNQIDYLLETTEDGSTLDSSFSGTKTFSGLDSSNQNASMTLSYSGRGLVDQGGVLKSYVEAEITTPFFNADANPKYVGEDFSINENGIPEQITASSTVSYSDTFFVSGQDVDHIVIKLEIDGILSTLDPYYASTSVGGVQLVQLSPEWESLFSDSNYYGDYNVVYPDPTLTYENFYGTVEDIFIEIEALETGVVSQSELEQMFDLLSDFDFAGFDVTYTQRNALTDYLKLFNTNPSNTELNLLINDAISIIELHFTELLSEGIPQVTRYSVFDETILSAEIPVINGLAEVGFYLDSNIQFNWNATMFEEAGLFDIVGGKADFFNTLKITEVSGFNANGNGINIDVTDSLGFSFLTTAIENQGHNSVVNSPSVISLFMLSLFALSYRRKQLKH